MGVTPAVASSASVPQQPHPQRVPAALQPHPSVSRAMGSSVARVMSHLQ